MLQILRIGVCVFGLTTAHTSAFTQTGTNDGFELVREEDNILVYERWVTFPKSDPPISAREVKSEFYVKGSIHDALALILDESRIYEWQNHVSEFKVYPQTDSAWLEYSYHDIPWPVSDQDHFLRYTVQDVEAEGIFVTFETVEDSERAPVQKGVSRMTLAGSWYFQELPGTEKIKVTYRILSMPGNLPRFITDPVIRNNLMSTVRAYIDILENGYQP